MRVSIFRWVVVAALAGHVAGRGAIPMVWDGAKATIGDVKETLSSRARAVADTVEAVRPSFSESPGWLGSLKNDMGATLDGARSALRLRRDAKEDKNGVVGGAVATFSGVAGTVTSRAKRVTDKVRRKPDEDTHEVAPPPRKRSRLAAVATLVSTSLVAKTTASMWDDKFEEDREALSSVLSAAVNDTGTAALRDIIDNADAEVLAAMSALIVKKVEEEPDKRVETAEVVLARAAAVAALEADLTDKAASLEEESRRLVSAADELEIKSADVDAMAHCVAIADAVARERVESLGRRADALAAASEEVEVRAAAADEKMTRAAQLVAAAELAEASSLAAEARALRATETAEIRTADAELEARAIIEAAKAEKVKVEEACARLRLDIDSREREVEAAARDVHAERRDVEARRASIEDALREASALDTKRSELSTLEMTLASARAEVKERLDRCSALEADLDSRLRSIEAAQAALDQSRADFEARAADFQTSNATLKSLLDAVAEREADVDARTKALETRERDLRERSANEAAYYRAQPRNFEASRRTLASRLAEIESREQVFLDKLKQPKRDDVAAKGASGYFRAPVHHAIKPSGGYRPSFYSPSNDTDTETHYAPAFKPAPRPAFAAHRF